MLSPEVLLPMACGRQLRRRGIFIAARLPVVPRNKQLVIRPHYHGRMVYLPARGIRLKKIEIVKLISHSGCKYEVHSINPILDGSAFYRETQGRSAVF